VKGVAWVSVIEWAAQANGLRHRVFTCWRRTGFQLRLQLIGIERRHSKVFPAGKQFSTIGSEPPISLITLTSLRPSFH